MPISSNDSTMQLTIPAHGIHRRATYTPAGISRSRALMRISAKLTSAKTTSVMCEVMSASRYSGRSTAKNHTAIVVKRVAISGVRVRGLTEANALGKSPCTPKPVEHPR
jgi:hypothetical protein